jgi:hypothetical protein
MIALKLLKTGNYMLSFEILGSILVLGLLVSMFLRISSRAAVKSEQLSAAPAE